jgi:hypothetical protein
VAEDFVIRIRADDAATATVKKIQAALGKVTEPIEKSQKRLSRLGDLGQAGLGKLQKGFGRVESAARGVVDRIVEIVPGLTAITGAASLAGLSALAVRFGNFGFSLNRSSKLLGMNAQDLAAWHVAAKRAGVSADEFDSSMSGSQMAIRGAAYGANPQAMMMLTKMGVQIQRNQDGSINYLKTQQQIMDALGRQKNVEGQRDAANALGMGALLPMIQQGTYAADRARAIRKGLVPSASEIAKAQQFHQDINDLEDSVSGLGNSIGSKLVPILDPLVTGFSRWLDGHRAQIADQIGAAVQKIANWLQGIDWDGVVSKAGKFYDSIGGIQGIALAVAAIKFSGPISGVLNLIASLGRLSTVAIPGAAGAFGALGLAGVAAFAAIKAAEATGLAPETDEQKGIDAVKKGDWWAASQYLPAADFARALAARTGGTDDATIAARLEAGANPTTGLDSAPARLKGNKSAGAGVMSDPNAAKMANFFVDRGWSKEQAAGIAANLWKESFGNAGAVGDNGNAYGIAQWHADRQSAFKKWSGIDIRNSTQEQQLAFVDYELRHGEATAGRMLAATNTAEDAGAAVSRYYERPADVEGEAATRGNIAAMLMTSAYGKLPPDSSTPAGTHDAESALNGSTATSAADETVAPSAPASPGASNTASVKHEVHVKFDNVPPGVRVDTKSSDGGYMPTRVNYAMNTDYGAIP